MKNNKVENFMSQLASIKMQESEKAEIRRQILAYSYTHSSSIESPYLPRVFTLKKMVSVTLIAILSIGALSKPASAKALPGELLYPVKIIHEEIVAATKTTHQEKIEHEIKRTQTRIEEATELASKESLSEENQLLIAKNIEKHTKKIQEELTEVEQEDPIKALEISTQVEDTLKGNAQVLKEALNLQEENQETATPEETGSDEESLNEETLVGDEMTPEENLAVVDENPEKTGADLGITLDVFSLLDQNGEEKTEDVQHIGNEKLLSEPAQEEVKSEVSRKSQEVSIIMNELEQDIREVQATSQKVQAVIVGQVVEPGSVLDPEPYEQRAILEKEKENQKS